MAKQFKSVWGVKSVRFIHHAILKYYFNVLYRATSEIRLGRGPLGPREPAGRRRRRRRRRLAFWLQPLWIGWKLPLQVPLQLIWLCHWILWTWLLWTMDWTYLNSHKGKLRRKSTYSSDDSYHTGVVVCQFRLEYADCWISKEIKRSRVIEKIVCSNPCSQWLWWMKSYLVFFKVIPFQLYQLTISVVFAFPSMSYLSLSHTSLLSSDFSIYE